MLRSDVVVSKEVRFGLGEHDHAAGPVGESLEHPFLSSRLDLS